MNKIIYTLRHVVLYAVFLVSACTGGGGDDGPGQAPLFTVGGAVSGLGANNHIVLQNNGGDDLTVSADGGFTFSTLIADGAGYSVTVLSQPQGATCTVNNGAGTVAGANVANVAVICAANTYTVGGVVSGLDAGNSVVLQNNGGDNLTVSGNGGFAFSTALGDGAGYDVTVLTQPAGQVCTVDKPAGTVSGMNVTDITVTCEDAAYTIGGSVTGLADGKSVVLQNNNADNLTLTANGNFTFATAMANGSHYGVTVHTQPVGQTCTVTGGNGTVAGASVANVAVKCVGWRTATLLETSNVDTAQAPQVAFDNNGNAIAVWQHGDGVRKNIMANRYTAGSGWGTASLIESDNGGDAFSPQIVFDDSGNATAVWAYADGVHVNIMANRNTAGSGWGTAVAIESDDAGDGDSPEIASDAAGNVVAVWPHFDGTRWNIMANRYTAGSGWGTEVLIENDNAGGAAYPQIAVDASGNAIAVWQQNDGTRYNIMTNRYTAGAGWGTAVLIESDNAGSALLPQVAIDSAGNAIAVWHQNDGTRTNIMANRYTASSGWGTAELIETDNVGSALDAQIGFDGAGNAVAVWRQNDGTRNNIIANRYTVGSGWGTAELIETDNAGGAASPQIALDGAGNAIAVWQQHDGTRNNIVANRYTTGSGWGTAEFIETDNAGGAMNAQIAFDGAGNAIAVWQQSDGVRENIWANIYQ